MKKLERPPPPPVFHIDRERVAFRVTTWCGTVVDLSDTHHVDPRTIEKFPNLNYCKRCEKARAAS